VAFLRPKRIL